MKEISIGEFARRSRLSLKAHGGRAIIEMSSSAAREAQEAIW